MDYEVVDEVPPITREGGKSKYDELLEAAEANGKIRVGFDSADQAHSRAGSIRNVVSKRENADSFDVTVRGSSVYVAFSSGTKKSSKKTTTRKTKAKKRPARSKASKTAEATASEE